MLPYIVNQLPQYESDPVVVSAMRRACHHNLYALANSSGMNGIGADTVVRAARPGIITAARVLAWGLPVLALGFGAMWVLGVRRLRGSEEYRRYKGFLREESNG